MTSSGVPVGDTTLLAKLREQGVHTWERRIMSDGHLSMFSADITDEVLAVIEAAQSVHATAVVRYGVESPEFYAAMDALSDALAPFVGEAT